MTRKSLQFPRRSPENSGTTVHCRIVLVSASDGELQTQTFQTTLHVQPTFSQAGLFSVQIHFTLTNRIT